MRISRYTIIEMLTVIVIGAILVSISIPAFSRMMTGNAPSMAAREIMGKLASARSYAAANKCYVAVVFPRTESHIENKFKYTSYRICEITNDNGTFKWSKWLDNWNFLPDGVAVVADFKSPGSTDEYNAGSSKRNRTIKKCDVKDMTGSSSTVSTDLCNAIVFTPLGVPYNNEGVRIAIQMGIVEGGTFTARPDMASLCLPLVVRVTGKVKFYDKLVAP